MKKRLLFIEDQVLRFDQAAGAKASFMYLKMLVDMGLCVTFIAGDFKKSESYADQLRSVGIKVLTGRWFHLFWRLWMLLYARKFDYVFFNRPMPTRYFIGYIKKFSSAKILYQCHDLHYLRLKRQYEIDQDDNTLEESKYFESLEIDLIRKSDVYLTFSKFEKETIEKKIPDQRIEVIPLFFYEDLVPPVTDFSQRKGILYVGGFSHQPNIDAVLWFCRDVLPEIRVSCPDVIFHIVGSDPPPEIRRISDRKVELMGFVSEQKLEELYRQVKLVVVPLRYGAGVKGKTVEAIHFSLPLVSTAIGIEGIGLGKIVPPADNPKAFADRVVALYNDESKLVECSFLMHNYARENLTIPAAKFKIENILDSLNN